MTVTDQQLSLTDTQRQRWEAYIAWQRQQTPGSLLRTLPEGIETVDAFLYHMVTALDAMIEAWWLAHPEVHPAEGPPDA